MKSPARDIIRAYQYLYYVEALSLISDYEYDRLQAEYEEETGDEIPVGSDRASDYTVIERATAVLLKSNKA